jgi:hypothetical protein
MFRTPKFQTLIGGSTPISSTTAYSGTTNSRIGLHNDAFLSSNSDMGTFSNTKTEYPYLDTQSKYTFCGGESAALFPTKQNCSVVFGWLTRFHYNYLNSGYHPDVLSLWKTNGCYDEIVRRLGYRFELVNSNITNGILTINIKNVGFANVSNQRDVYVVLKNTINGTVYSFKLNTDIRLWNAGATTTITENLSTRAIPVGTYDIFINAPDKAINNSKYSIQFANGNIYDGVTGYNKLNQKFTSKLVRISSTVNYKIFVYDLTGKLVSNNTENLEKGLYIIKMVDEKTNNVHIQKLYKN